MDRKYFLSAVGTLAFGSALSFRNKNLINNTVVEVVYKKPPYLNKGDVIGITAPAGYTTVQDVQTAVNTLQSWGYQVQLGTTIGKKDFTFGGTDEERTTDLQQMLDDPNIKAIICARGGYGVVRIIDRLNWTRFKQKPKWVVGFSDITVLHNHIHQVCKVASVHSKMTNSFPDDPAKAEPIQIETIYSINDALSGRQLKYTSAVHPQNKLGTSEGVLIGGNMRTLETLAGTASDINTEGKILFVEDTGEYLYSIDRMFWNLKRTGKLKNLKGLIVGGFKIKTDEDEEPFGKTLQDIVLEKIVDHNYPVCFDFPVGHQRANFALKCGVKHKLSITHNSVTLNEII